MSKGFHQETPIFLCYQPWYLFQQIVASKGMIPVTTDDKHWSCDLARCIPLFLCTNGATESDKCQCLCCEMQSFCDMIEHHLCSMGICVQEGKRNYWILVSLLCLWLQMQKITAISDWSISTQKCRIYIHYCGVFSRKSYVDKNNIQIHRVLIKKVYNF